MFRVALLLSCMALPAWAEAPTSFDRTSAEGRRSVRGIPVDPQPGESPELSEMRRFEERVFARTAGAPALPAQTSLPESFLKSLKLPVLPVRFDARVLRYLEFYRNDPKGRAIMQVWLRKQGRWRAMMQEVLARHDLPKDLIYVSMIESGYEPSDLSRVGAAGLWQFMQAGGKIYGLDQNYWVDERRDPTRSTEAVAFYMKDLMVRFGNWHLALAAFNAGYGAVLRSMQKYNTNDYWELCKHESGLPWETCLYVPKAIASAIVGENRKAFGYDDGSEDRPFAPEHVRVPGGTALSTAARACGISESQMSALNPELRHGRTPPGRGYDLRIPAGSTSRFLAAFPKGSADTERYDVHVIRFGERLDDIARNLRVSAKELARLNHVEDTTDLKAGTEILVPRERGTAAPSALPPAEAEVFLVGVPERPFAYPDRKRIFYRTRDGDTIETVTAYFHVSPQELAQWNALELGANLTSKMVLQLFVPRSVDLSSALLIPESRVRLVPAGSREFFETAEAMRGRKRLLYECKRGDTLAKVGRRFGLTPGDLARINQFSYQSELSPGQRIVVYCPVTPAAKKEAQGRLRQATRARLVNRKAPKKKKQP